MTGRNDPVRRILVKPQAAEDFSDSYWDSFVIGATQAVDAEQWARLCLRGVQAAGGLFGTVVWHGVLGFDLAGAEVPETLAGWRIAERSSTRFVLDADGRLMAGRMVFDTSAGEATWTTMLRYHHAAARPVWSVAGHAHRALVPRQLVGVRRVIERSQSAHSPTPPIPPS